MSDARIPGPLGGSLLPHIDGGTLARIASPLPGVLNLEDQAREWARRQLRRGVRRGLELAGNAVYDAAMAELQRRKGDVEAMLRLIAGLPEGIRQQVAYEAFAAGFSHYLPKKLLRQYVWGQGRDLTLTLKEMVDCNPAINLLRSQAFRDLGVAGMKQPGVAVPFELGILSVALTNGTLGQFSARTKGTLVVQAGGEWQAQGTMSFYDEWDFDPKDFSTGGRSFQGEVKTRIANALLPGQGFKIFSETTDFRQSQNESTVVWVGGEPKGEPDRIAALDVELSKPDK